MSGSSHSPPITGTYFGAKRAKDRSVGEKRPPHRGNNVHAPVISAPSAGWLGWAGWLAGLNLRYIYILFKDIYTRIGASGAILVLIRLCVLRNVTICNERGGEVEWGGKVVWWVGWRAGRVGGISGWRSGGVGGRRSVCTVCDSPCITQTNTLRGECKNYEKFARFDMTTSEQNLKDSCSRSDEKVLRNNRDERVIQNDNFSTKPER